jgi:hypothetical protein
MSDEELTSTDTSEDGSFEHIETFYSLSELESLDTLQSASEPYSVSEDDSGYVSHYEVSQVNLLQEIAPYVDEARAMMDLTDIQHPVDSTLFIQVYICSRYFLRSLGFR